MKVNKQRIIKAIVVSVIAASALSVTAAAASTYWFSFSVS